MRGRDLRPLVVLALLSVAAFTAVNVRGDSLCTADGIVCLLEVDASQPLQSRVPLILIHGWTPDSVPGPARPEIWNDFVAYYTATPELQQRTKLYLVSFTSHVRPLLLLGRGMLDLVDELSVRDPAGFGSKPVTLVAHSMGGLIARTFLSLPQMRGPNAGLTGAQRTLRLITLGTPHHGSVMANGPAMRERAGPWSPAIDTFELLLFRNGPRWNQINRSDMLWDNYDNLLDYDAHPQERNPVLESLNSTTAYDSKLVAYAGSIAPGGSCGGDVYCWGSTAIGGIFALPNDGVVPISSALFYNSSGTPRVLWRIFPGYNHSQIATGIAGGLELFGRIARDLTDVISARPGRPTLTASAQGNVVTVAWTAGIGAPPESYSLAVGRTAGASDVFARNVGLVTTVSGSVPSGRYYFRATAINGGGSATSDEVALRVGNDPPGRPTLTVSVNGNLVNVSWASGPGGAPESYVLGVGTSPGASNVFSQNVGGITSATGSIPNGIYYLRVTAINAAGSSTSNEVQATVGSAALTLTPGRILHVRFRTHPPFLFAGQPVVPDQLMANFRNLRTTGTPTITTRLFDGATLLGSFSRAVSAGFSYAVFVSGSYRPRAPFGPVVPFTSINIGTIAGVFEISIDAGSMTLDLPAENNPARDLYISLNASTGPNTAGGLLSWVSIDGFAIADPH